MEWGFEHIQTEIFYEGDLKKGYKICNDAVTEDKACSDKYNVDLGVVDHLTYYDIDFAGIILACQWENEETMKFEKRLIYIFIYSKKKLSKIWW